MIGLALIAACSVPGVHPTTVERIVHVESRGDALAIAFNDGGAHRAKDLAEAAAVARTALARGSGIDIGLMQVNSSHLKRLDLTLEDLLDPCKNIAAGTRILKENYDRAEARLGAGQEALQAALSAYNTGNFRSGLSNGYVAAVYGGPLPRQPSGPRTATPETADIVVSFEGASTDDDSKPAAGRSNASTRRGGGDIRIVAAAER